MISDTPAWFVFTARVAGQVGFDGAPLDLGDDPDELDAAAAHLETVRDELRYHAADLRGIRLLEGRVNGEEAWRVLFAARRYGWRVGPLDWYSAYCCIPAGKEREALQRLAEGLGDSARETVRGRRWIVRRKESAGVSFFDLVVDLTGSPQVEELHLEVGAELWDATKPGGCAATP
jgi:hypothetical protein